MKEVEYGQATLALATAITYTGIGRSLPNSCSKCPIMAESHCAPLSHTLDIMFRKAKRIQVEPSPSQPHLRALHELAGFEAVQNVPDNVWPQLAQLQKDGPFRAALNGKSPAQELWLVRCPHHHIIAKL